MQTDDANARHRQRGAPYQIVYIKDGKEHPIRYRRASVEAALRELQKPVEHGDGIGNGNRYRAVIHHPAGGSSE